MPYHIIKGSRTYGGYGYDGPSCLKANVERGKLYTSLDEAFSDAEKLKNVNSVGFVVFEVFSGQKMTAPPKEDVVYGINIIEINYRTPKLRIKPKVPKIKIQQHRSERHAAQKCELCGEHHDNSVACSLFKNVKPLKLRITKPVTENPIECAFQSKPLCYFCGEARPCRCGYTLEDSKFTIRSPYPHPLSSEIELANNKATFVRSVKAYCERTGLSLIDAKRVMDEYKVGGSGSMQKIDEENAKSSLICALCGWSKPDCECGK